MFKSFNNKSTEVKASIFREEVLLLVWPKFCDKIYIYRTKLELSLHIKGNISRKPKGLFL